MLDTVLALDIPFEGNHPDETREMGAEFGRASDPGVAESSGRSAKGNGEWILNDVEGPCPWGEFTLGIAIRSPK